MSAADVSNGFLGGRKKPGRRYDRPARDELLDLLARRELTARRAAQLIQRGYETVRKVLRKMRDERLVHISHYEIHDVGPHEAVWALGDESDAPNPPRLTDSERCRRYRAKRALPPKPKCKIMRALMDTNRA